MPQQRRVDYAVFDAAFQGNCIKIRSSIEGGQFDVNAVAPLWKSVYQPTALAYAVWGNQPEAVRVLLELGADPDQPDGDGKEGKTKDKIKPGGAPAVKWLRGGKSMRIGGDLFDVEAISKHLGLDKAASKGLCWPVILSRKKGDRALINCPCPEKAGHSSMTDAAHARPDGFNLDEICKDKKLRVSEPVQKGKGKRKRGQ